MQRISFFNINIVTLLLVLSFAGFACSPRPAAASDGTTAGTDAAPTTGTDPSALTAPAPDPAAPAASDSTVTPPAGGSVTLAWGSPAETDPSLAGYKVYYGSTSGTYDNAVNAGMTTTWSLSGLPAGTYYLAVTAYDAYGNETDYSNEVTKTVP